MARITPDIRWRHGRRTRPAAERIAMGEGTFERISNSDKRLYGPRKVIFCGFPAKARPTVAALMKMVGLEDVPALFVSAGNAGETVGTLFQRPGDAPVLHDSDLPRAIIVGGITEMELQQLMGGARASKMQPPLWAVLTPVSETWLLADLLRELASERTALERTASPPS